MIRGLLSVHGHQMHSARLSHVNDVLSHEGGKHTAKGDWARHVFPQYAREGNLVAYTWRFAVCFTWKAGWGGREVRRFVYVGECEVRRRRAMNSARAQCRKRAAGGMYVKGDYGINYKGAAAAGQGGCRDSGSRDMGGVGGGTGGTGGFSGSAGKCGAAAGQGGRRDSGEANCQFSCMCQRQQEVMPFF